MSIRKARETCDKCLSSNSIEMCLIRRCPLYIDMPSRTDNDIDEIIERCRIKLKKEE